MSGTASLLLLQNLVVAPTSQAADEFVYSPNMQKTPSLRAGIIKSPYSLTLSSTFKEQKVANTINGNYCMPRCDEPWVEAIFTDGSGLKVQLQVSPLVKLTNKINISLSDLGTPLQLIARIGAYLTGTFYEEEDLVSSDKAIVDGQEFYYYELNAVSANGHSFSAVTIKDECLYLLVGSATDKAWAKNEQKLKGIVKSFKP